MKSTTIFGGVSQNPQVAALKQGVDIVVACPGRLEDLMKQGFVTLDAVEITVLDEADHMADLGFLPVVTRIMDKTPKGGQRMLFSATLDNGVDKLVAKYLQNEVLHSVDEANSPVAAMTHHVFQVESQAGKTALVHALASGSGRRLLFMRTKHHAKKLAQQLTEAGIPAVDLHGNLSQPARDRNLAAFSAGEVKVLVATDVAARGVHVDSIELVIHVDPPTEHKAYLHRSGRTARAGAEGDVVTIMTSAQRQDVKDLMRKAGIDVTPISVTAQSPEVVALIGEVAPYVKSAPRQAQPQRGQSQSGRSQGANAQRKRENRDHRGQSQTASRSESGRTRGTADQPGTAGPTTSRRPGGTGGQGASRGQSGAGSQSGSRSQNGAGSQSTARQPQPTGSVIRPSQSGGRGPRRAQG